jgi:hypothetical protein
MNETSALLFRRHLRFGWWSLLVFLSLGIVLEALHGFKVGWLLDVSQDTRRLMLRLAHSHGTILGLVHIAFAFTLHCAEPGSERRFRLVSPALLGASVLLPGGFFLGGLVTYGGDPGLGVLLVPLGAALLLVGVLLCAWKV